MKYDHDEIIEKATTLFWQRGFQAAGMRDITGIRHAPR